MYLRDIAYMFEVIPDTIVQPNSEKHINFHKFHSTMRTMTDLLAHSNQFSLFDNEQSFVFNEALYTFFYELPMLEEKELHSLSNEKEAK